MIFFSQKYKRNLTTESKEGLPFMLLSRSEHKLETVAQLLSITAA